jgi:mono/diheme cytochrome c family protein
MRRDIVIPERSIPVLSRQIIAAALITAGLSAPVLAASDQTASGDYEEVALGRAEFERHCASCHGKDGTGGPRQADMLAHKMLTRQPPDLTVLSRNNGGQFPEWQVHGIIDGRKAIKAHGSRNMPVWGTRFGKDAAKTPSPLSTETAIDERILNLIEFLKSIQR